MDNIAGMRVFTRVVDAGSFSAAGREIGMSPSAVSRRIGELEDDLGARLFQRTTRKLSLTEAGGIYDDRVRAILADVDAAKRAVAELAGTPTGVLRLSVPASVARRHVAPALADFHQRFPAVEVVLAVSDRLVDLIDEGFDLAIRVGRLSDSGLIARKIGSARRIVCASPAYLAQAGVPETPADLESHSCVTFRSHPGSNAWAFRGPDGEHLARVTGRIFANDGEALSAAAVAGLGVVLLPEWLVGTELRAGRLREILAGYRPEPGTTPLYAVYPHQRHLPPKVRVLIDFLVERFAAHYAWDTAQ